MNDVTITDCDPRYQLLRHNNRNAWCNLAALHAIKGEGCDLAGVVEPPSGRRFQRNSDLECARPRRVQLRTAELQEMCAICCYLLRRISKQAGKCSANLFCDWYGILLIIIVVIAEDVFDYCARFG